MVQSDLVILSGAYASSELTAEFGHLPPAMLPIGNGKLYELQIKLANSLPGSVSITLSLPDDFEIPEYDKTKLEKEGVRIVRVPVGLSLRQSLDVVLRVVDDLSVLYLLHGDTLVQGKQLAAVDTYFIERTTDYYNWGEVVSDQGELRLKTGLGDGERSRDVLCGFFSFSDVGAFKRVIDTEETFLGALNAYSRDISVQISSVEAWFDFGHLNLYYQARRDMLVTRAFNSIRCEGNRLIKSSENTEKMDAEAQWYQDFPPVLRTYLPQFLGSRTNSRQGQIRREYELEYLFMPNLADLAVYSALPIYQWRMIIEKCLAFLEKCNSISPEVGMDVANEQFYRAHFEFLIRDKTTSRLSEFSQATGFDLNQPMRLNGKCMPSAAEMVEELIEQISPTASKHLRLWHGDFFFGNILFDARSRSIKVVDPRGESSKGYASVFGDKRYDQAKLLHSLIGHYDHIIANRMLARVVDGNNFELDIPPSCLGPNILKELGKLSIGKEPLLSRENLSLTALLFFSMLPLHAEDPVRQQTFLANGARLFGLSHELQ